MALLPPVQLRAAMSQKTRRNERFDCTNYDSNAICVNDMAEIHRIDSVNSVFRPETGQKRAQRRRSKIQRSDAASHKAG
ncbi:MAG: hypothetical protein ABIT04_13400 [Novosphingobium sp.]